MVDASRAPARPLLHTHLTWHVFDLAFHDLNMRLNLCLCSMCVMPVPRAHTCHLCLNWDSPASFLNAWPSAGLCAALGRAWTAGRRLSVSTMFAWEYNLQSATACLFQLQELTSSRKTGLKVEVWCKRSCNYIRETKSPRWRAWRQLRNLTAESRKSCSLLWYCDSGVNRLGGSLHL